MVFQGDLANINLASVFQNLLHNRQTGTLVLRRRQDERHVYFRSGIITMFSQGPGRSTPLAEFLVRMGVVKEDDVSAAQKKRRGRARLSQIISKMGLASDEEIRQAVSTYVHEEMYDLFTWDGGTFEFREGPPAEGVFDPEVALADLAIETNEVILEAARRIDEWDRINRHVGSSRDIYVARKERDRELAALDDPATTQVLALLDGRRPVAQVVEESGLGRFQVMRVLAELVSKGLLRQLSAAELHAEAKRAFEQGRLTDAAALLERTLETEHGNVHAHLLLAAVRERMGKPDDAASAFKVAAGLLLEDGQVKEAVEALRSAVRLRPHDLAARERLYHLLKDAGRRAEARDALIETASYFMKMGLAERARTLLEDGLSFAAADADVLRLLADVYIEAGDTAKAAELFCGRAETALEQADYQQALRWYEEVLKIRPADDEARRRIVEITSGALERRRRRRRLIFRSIAAALIIGALAAWLAREYTARRAAHRLQQSIISDVLSGDAARARANLIRFAQANRYTRPAAEARRMCSLLDALRAGQDFKRAAELEAAGKFKEAAEIYKRLNTMDLPAEFMSNVARRLSALPASAQ